MNQRYKVWTPQGRILDKFTVLEEPKEEQSLTFSYFYSIVSLLQWVHATYKTWLKIENIKNVLNNKTLNKKLIWSEISRSKIGKKLKKSSK